MDTSDEMTVRSDVHDDELGVDQSIDFVDVGERIRAAVTGPGEHPVIGVLRDSDKQAERLFLVGVQRYPGHDVQRYGALLRLARKKGETQEQ